MRRKLLFLTALFVCSSLFFATGAGAQEKGNGYNMKKIVIDPGHGGKAPGCTYGGYKEKDIVLAVALRVGELIHQNLPDVEVVFTRKTDKDIGLMERGNMANKAKADLFVSIHADAQDKGRTTANGSSTWVMGLSKEESNLQLAMKENSAITYEDNYETKYEGFNPNDPASYIMFALMQSVDFDQSVKLATLFQNHYKQNTSISTSRGVKQAAFLVLHRTTMPSILTEIGFLSNEKDRKFMTSKAGQEKIARSIFNAISEYKGLVEGNAQIVILKETGDAATDHVPAVTENKTLRVEKNGSNAFVSGKTEKTGVVFRVQVSASKTPIDTKSKSRFGQYAGQVTERKIGNYYKYFVGETDSYSEALSLQRKIRNKFSDAFIVAFENDAPVKITDNMKRK